MPDAKLHLSSLYGSTARDPGQLDIYYCGKKVLSFLCEEDFE